MGLQKIGVLHSQIRVLGSNEHTECSRKTKGNESTKPRWSIPTSVEAGYKPKSATFSVEMSHQLLMSREGSCGRCAMADEIVNHLLFKCPYARLVQAISPIHAPSGGEMSDSLYSNVH